MEQAGIMQILTERPGITFWEILVSTNKKLMFLLLILLLFASGVVLRFSRRSTSIRGRQHVPQVQSNNFDGNTKGAIATTLTVNNVGLYWSGWYQNGSAYVQANGQGAYGHTLVSGSTQFILNVDVSPLTGASVAANRYPRLAWRIDNGVQSTQVLTNSTTHITLSASLTTAAHDVQWTVMGLSGTEDRWMAPASVCRITSIVVDRGASVRLPRLRSKLTLYFGDSITDGNQVLGANYDPTTTSDATQDYVAYVSGALGSEYIVAAHGGQGWVTAGASGSNVPMFYNAGGKIGTFNKYDALHSRSFATQPDYIVVNHGTNDGAASDASVAAAVVAYLSAQRITTPKSKIFVLIPFNGTKRNAIQAGYQKYVSNHTLVSGAGAATIWKGEGDTNCFLIDLGAEAQNGQGEGASFVSTDGTHLTPAGQAQDGARLAAAMQAALNAQSTATISERKFMR